MRNINANQNKKKSMNIFSKTYVKKGSFEIKEFYVGIKGIFQNEIKIKTTFQNLKGL